MKINEIAINENKYDLIRKALPRIERLPGETMKDAISRAKSELGGVKSADNLISPEEMAALRRDPVPSSGSVAGTDPSTGFLVPGRVIPTQANTSYNLNLPKTPAAADPVPSSGPAVWRGQGDSVPGRAPPTAPWVKPQVWRRRPPSEPVALSQQNPTTGPAAINIQAAERMRQAAAAKRAPKAPADDLANQIRPGTDTPKTPGGRQEPGMDPPAAPANGINLSKDELLDLLKNRSSDGGPAAIKAPGLDNNPGIFRRNPIKTGIGVGSAVGGAGMYFANQNIPGIKSVTPVGNNQSDQKNPPTDAEIQQQVDNDPDMQELNKKRADAGLPPLEESTNELNRIVFLSRP